MADQRRPYGKWSKEELLGAEATARHFLEENSSPIAETMQAKARFLEKLIHRIGAPQTTFEDRLEYFARISEVAQLIQQDADGFFELASQPVVARILGTVKKKRR